MHHRCAWRLSLVDQRRHPVWPGVRRASDAAGAALDLRTARFGNAPRHRRLAQGASGPGFGHGPGSRVAVLYRVPS